MARLLKVLLFILVLATIVEAGYLYYISQNKKDTNSANSIADPSISKAVIISPTGYPSTKTQFISEYLSPETAEGPAIHPDTFNPEVLETVKLIRKWRVNKAYVTHISRSIIDDFDWSKNTITFKHPFNDAALEVPYLPEILESANVYLVELPDQTKKPVNKNEIKKGDFVEMVSIFDSTENRPSGFSITIIRGLN